MQRGIERGSLRKVAQLHLRRSNLGNRANSSEQRLCYACLARFGKHVVQIFLHASVPREISIDKLRRFFLLDAQLLRETERREAINDSEVDGLRCSAMVRGLRQWADAEDFLRRARMDVLAVAKRLY